MANDKKVVRLNERIKNTKAHIEDVRTNAANMEKKLQEKLVYLAGKIKEANKKS